jgi:hypothetical protein
LRAGGESEHVQAVQQAEQAGSLLVGEPGQHVRDTDVGAEVTAARGPEPGGIFVARQGWDDGIGQGAQYGALAVSELSCHSLSFGTTRHTGIRFAEIQTNRPSTVEPV